MRNRARRLFPLLLCLVMACAPYCDALTASAYAYCGAPMPKTAVGHTESRFWELPFMMPDLKELSDRAETLQTRIDAGGDVVKQQEELEELFGQLADAESMTALAYAHYALDTADPLWQSRYEQLSTRLDPIHAALNAAALKLSEAKALKKVYDAETVAALRQADRLYDPSAAPLFAQEQALLLDFDRMQTGFSTDVDGTTWTLSALMEDQTLPFADWYTIYRRFAEAYHQAAGELLIRLVQLRKEIASALGFASYPAYRYAAYGRDYSPLESEAFSESVRQKLVPLFRSLASSAQLDRELLDYGDSYPEQQMMERIGDVVSAILPTLCEPWAYMQRNHLYDTTDRPNKLAGSFTTYFSAEHAPFLLTTWDSSSAMPTTILHEFGHYAGYYFRSESGNAEGGTLDLAEVDSQGLELLAIPYYPTIFGRRADEAKNVRLFDTLYAVLSGCAVDAFELWLYSADHLSVESIDERFGALCKAYGLDAVGFTETVWSDIGHIFRSPSYYISYATAAVTALLIYFRSVDSPKAGQRIYRTILLRPYGTQFRKLLHKCSLTDPLSDDTIAKIAKEMSNFTE